MNYIQNSGRYFLAILTAMFASIAVAQEHVRPDLAGGAWVETLSALEDPRWRLEDLICASCNVRALQYTLDLLNDPRNDALSLAQLRDLVSAFNRNYLAGQMTETAIGIAASFDQIEDPVNQCVPTGFFFAAGPLPIWIEQYEDRVELRYEFWHTVRTVYTDGRDHPVDLALSRMGHSIGWYDGQTLVAETVGIEPHIFLPVSGVDGMRSSARSRAIERFTRSDDGERLVIETTIVDPVILREPVTLLSHRLLAPEVEYLDEPQCEALSGVR